MEKVIKFALIMNFGLVVADNLSVELLKLIASVARADAVNPDPTLISPRFDRLLTALRFSKGRNFP